MTRPSCFVAACLTLQTIAFGAELPFEVIASDLDNPCGIAIHPDSGHVYVALGGSQKIVRIIEGEVQDVIINFPKDVYGKGPSYDIGPLGLAFLDDQQLVVGGGGLPDGEDIIRIYDLPNLGDDPIDATKMAQTIGPLPQEDGVLAEGNFFGIAIHPEKKHIYATANGDDEKGWVVAANRNSDKNTYSKLERFISTKEHVKTDAPVAITISPQSEIVIGQMGEIDESFDSRLSFYSAVDRKLLLDLETGLNDIVALAYGPQKENYTSSHLYALDFAWARPEEGGLFRIDAVLNDSGTQKIKTIRLCKLERPTSMAFAKDGSLIVTVFGNMNPEAAEKSGKVLKFPPGL